MCSTPFLARILATATLARKSPRRPKTSRPAYFDALEQRALLSASFALADLAGTWSYFGAHDSGSIVVNAAGEIIDGSFRDESDSLHSITGGAAEFSDSSGGAIDVTVTYDALSSVYYFGMLDGSKQIATLVDSQHTDCPVLVKLPGDGCSLADFSGTWNMITPDGKGSITSDGNGHITGGSIVGNDGFRASLPKGSYSISSDGLVNLVVGPYDFSGTIAVAKDTIALNATSFVDASDNDYPSTLLLQKRSGSHSNADLAGTWFVSGYEQDSMGGWSFNGEITFDGNGRIVGSATTFDPFDGNAVVSGTYAVTPTGQFTATLKLFYDYGGSDAFTDVHKISAWINPSTTCIAANGVATSPGSPGWRLDEILCFTSDNTDPSLTAITPFATAIAGVPFSFSYEQILAHSNAFDLDGETLAFEINAFGNGELEINDSPATLGDIITPGDDLTWTPAANAAGPATALLLTVADGLNWSMNPVPLIINTVAQPVISVTAKGPAAEVHTDTKGHGLYTFTRTGGDLASGLKVYYSVSGSADSGEDYVAFDDLGSIGFLPNQKTVTLDLTPIDDSDGDAGHNVIVTLVPDDYYKVLAAKSSAAITIVDNEPTVSIVGKGPASETFTATKGHGLYTFTRAGGDITEPLTATYAVSGSAQVNIDYLPFVNSGTITFLANQKTATLDLTPINDSLADSGHNVIVTLIPDDPDNPSYNILAAKSSASIAILDNEPTVTVVASKPTASETNPLLDASEGVFTFTRIGGDLAQPLTVDFSVTGSAVPGTDYETIGGTFTFDPLQTTKTVSVLPNDDSKPDLGHNVIVTLTPDPVTPAFNTTPLKSTATITIADNEPIVSVTATKPIASETNPNAAASQGLFTFTRTGGDLASSLTVYFNNTGTAQSDSDYVDDLPGSLTFGPNEVVKTLALTPIDDDQADLGENVVLTLVPADPNVYNTNPAKASATVTIADNEPVVSIVATKPAASELHDSKKGHATFALARTGGDLAAPLTVYLNIGGSTSNGDDYALLEEFVTFSPLEKTRLIDINPYYDNLIEGAETVIISLDTESTYNLSPTKFTATATLADYNQPIAFGTPDYLDGNYFTHDELADVLRAVDPEAQPITFKLVTVASGSIAVNGHIAVPGVTTIVPGDTVTWCPRSYYLDGQIAAFTLAASDGVNTSPPKTIWVSLWT